MNDSETPLSVPNCVLVVDDSRVERGATVAQCRRLGVGEILEAANGREALELLDRRESPPQLLIVDLEMPQMDGAALLIELQHRKLNMPIFVLSSREQALLDSVHEMGVLLGLRVERAIRKPLKPESLIEALRAIRTVRTSRAAHSPVDEMDLRAALDGDELQVHFQPKADLRTGAVRGVESLARWTHPRFGAIPPDQFIPLAERHDLIHALTLHVLHRSLRQAAGWQAMGLHLMLAVNVSPLLLERPGLADEIEALVRAHQLTADRLVLEVTESALVTQLALALATLAQLRLRGFGLSIDDYGTGFSSMRQLARVPFTELKVDRSFVRGAPERQSLQVMLRSSIDMASRLGLTTVAEGVETEDEWCLLQDCGCTFAQGWLIARAMPGEALPDWMREQRQRLIALAHAARRMRSNG